MTLSATASNPRVIYAGSAGGIFRSDDGGASWRDVSQGIRDVSLVATDQQRSEVAYAATGKPSPRAETRIYKTTDRGETWVASGTVPIAFAAALLVDPRDAGTVYVGGGCFGFFKTAASSPHPAAGQEASVYKSTDGGQSWQAGVGAVSNSMECIRELSLDPVTPTHLLSTALVGQWESFDGGRQWTQAAGTLPAARIVAHPKEPLTRYAITNIGGCGATVFVSNDGGLTWAAAAGSGLPQTPCHSIRLNALAIDPEVGRLFLATSNGVYRSGDGGANWIPVGGVAQLPTYDVVFDSADRRLIIATVQGIYYAPAPGVEPWTPASVADRSTRIAQIAVDPRDASILYASTQDAFLPGPPSGFYGRIFRSGDGGRAWGLISGSDPHDRGMMAVDAGGNLYTAGYYGVARLPAGSDQWEHLLDCCSGIAVDPRVPGVVYAYGNGLSMSRDGGRTWTLLSSENLGRLVIDPTDSKRMYAQGGFKRSSDGGVTWSKTSDDVTHVIAVAASKPNVIYRLSRYFEITGPTSVVNNESALFRSDDYGVSWSAVLHHPAENSNAVIAVDPRDENVVYIASGGVFRSTDGGKTWGSVSDNLPTTGIDCVVAAPNDRYLRIGTFDASAWQMAIQPRGRAVLPRN